MIVICLDDAPVAGISSSQSDVCTSGRWCCAYDMHSMRWEMALELKFFFFLPVPGVRRAFGISQGSTSWRLGGQWMDTARKCM